MSTHRLFWIFATIVGLAVLVYWLAGANELVTKVQPNQIYQTAYSHVGIEAIFQGFRR